MTYQQPGAYPGMPQYPGGVGLPPKPPAPETVRRAFFCMIAGAALSVIGVVVALTQLNAIRSVFETSLPNDDITMINSLVTATIVASVVIALIEVGLWLWIAFASKAGKNYARITGTVFFGVNAASTLFGTIGYIATSHNGSVNSTFASSDTVLGQIANWLTFLAGLAAVVLLWRKDAGPFFKPPQAFYPGPYGYAAYPPPPYPGYGYPQQPGAPGYPQQGYPQQATGTPEAPQQSPYNTPPQG
jgi:hypothetical protein